jgi:hypothetical protein
MKNPVILLTLFLASALSTSAQAPNLQTAGKFAVLAGGGIVNADAGTTIVGDVGSSPTPTVTGLLATQVTGTLYTAANAVLTTAQNDLTAAYVDAAGRPSCTALTGALGTGTNANLGPGLYCYSTAALLKLPHLDRCGVVQEGTDSADWKYQTIAFKSKEPTRNC